MIRDAPEPEGPEPEELKPENQKPEKTERTGSAILRHSRFFSRKEGEPMPYGIPERAGDGPMAFLEPGSRVSTVHLQMVKEEKSLYGLRPLSGPWQAAELVRPLFYGSDREMVVVLSLDTRNRPAAAETVAVGGLDSVAVDVRNLFKHALLNNAKGIMIFHNHPSGDAEPSGEDRALTSRVRQAGEILGISLVDHIILGDGCCYSLREESRLEDTGGEGVGECRL